MYNRLFTFGCSFTNYTWYTWADIINYDLGIPYQNWGISGIGNRGIHARLIECNIKNKLTKKDLIIVQWSSWSREDRYINNSWQVGGNIFSSTNERYDKMFLKKYWDVNNDIIQNSTAIISAQSLPITFQLSVPLTYESILGLDDIDDKMYTTYKTALPKNIFYIPEYKGQYPDPHPDILNHLDFVKHIYKKIGFEIKKETVDYFSKKHNDIIATIKEAKTDDWDLVLRKTGLGNYKVINCSWGAE
tara:strand:- start:2430 stop:3167 length:738 start_codon:yes stop_codon:yes gene_type:complete